MIFIVYLRVDNTNDVDIVLLAHDDSLNKSVIGFGPWVLSSNRAPVLYFVLFDDFHKCNFLQT